MIQRWRSGWQRTAAIALATGAIGSGAFFMYATQTNAQQRAALERGNKPGEWRYWGADAWSTRYSALDQINANNFDSLQVAWKWDAGQYGDDEYYRTTPLYANGRMFTVATTRSIRRPVRSCGSGRWTKASAGRKRRASSRVVVSPTGPTAPATSVSSS
jgi:glucose dehydrogenase